MKPALTHESKNVVSAKPASPSAAGFAIFGGFVMCEDPPAKNVAVCGEQ
jgi:hypothetical protein